jgi:hypothetical protein
VTPITHFYHETRMRNFWPNFTVPHTCRKWDKLVAWAEEGAKSGIFVVAIVLLGLIAHSIAAVCSNTIPPLKHARSMHLLSMILLHLYVQLDHLHPRDPPCSRC